VRGLVSAWKGVALAKSPAMSKRGVSVENQKCFIAYALPAPVLRYRSYAKAFSLSRKAMAVSIYHGANLEVCGTCPALCIAKRSCKS